MVHLGTSAQGGVANAILTQVAARVGALAHLAGNLPAEAALDLLRLRRATPGHRSQVSVAVFNPSTLGGIVEAARRQGLRPGDVGLRRISVGGEIVSAGLLRRAPRCSATSCSTRATA